MNYESIDDIFSANKRIRQKFLDVAEGISDTDAEIRPNGEKWSIKEVIEHVAMVGDGTRRICARLLKGASEAGIPASRQFSMPASFGEKATAIATAKVEAPDRVQPTGTVSIQGSLETLRAASDEVDAMRVSLSSLDLSAHKFPHPYFGDMTAAEWLVVAGLHEARHTQQIIRLQQKVLEEKSPG